MAKRQITAHKGGRTKFIPGFLATEETAAQLDAIKAWRNQSSDKHFSLADWVAEKAAEEIKIISVRSDDEKG
jgi:hypothetical protein